MLAYSIMSLGIKHDTIPQEDEATKIIEEGEINHGWR